MSRRNRVFLSFAVAAASAAAVILKAWTPLGGRISGARLERVRRSPHWRDGKFRNLIPTSKGDLLRSIVDAFRGNQIRTPKSPIPVHRLSASDFAAIADLRAVWVGHSSVIVDVDGVRVLTDPVWSERCSPSQSIGPKRFHPPHVPLGETGRVDAVVISHDHYDHLDMATVQALSPRGATFFVPLGIGAHLQRWGVPRFIALPARHYSGRSIHADETEWASWAIVGPRHRVFFSGDSGYFDEFKRIGEEHGPFDLPLIKIGAYGDTWPQIHMTPEETHAADPLDHVQPRVPRPVRAGRSPSESGAGPHRIHDAATG